MIEYENAPEQLKEFYFSEVINESYMVPLVKDVTGIDSEGNDVVTQITVPEQRFKDVTYWKLKSKLESVSWDKVERVIEKHQGNRDSVVDVFIGLAIETDKWEFYDLYLEWLKDCEAVALYNATEQLDEEGVAIVFDARELPLEPAFTATELNQWKISNYDVLRKAAYGSVAKQLEMQVDGLWEAHIADVKGKYAK
jgi:hypothetical protein